jgi:N-acetylglucosaminyl-diphospho-decaprenol L-rhamnosyltransferase
VPERGPLKDARRNRTLKTEPCKLPHAEIQSKRDAFPRASERTAWWDSFLGDGPVEVSVCIANWNCRELLRACLGSLLDGPQGVRLEVIVVDNASSDGAADMVAREFPEVVLVRNPANRGFARACNQAAERAGGRFLFFLNNDTMVPPGTLRRLVDYAEAHPEAGIVGPALRDASGQRQTSSRARPTPATFLHRTCLLRWTNLLRPRYRRYRRMRVESLRPGPVDVLMGAAMLVRRTVFFAAGCWDEDFFFGGEDLDLCDRIGRCHTIVYHPGVEITHLGRASTRLAIGPATTQILVGFARYLRKTGYTRRECFMYKLVMTLDAPLQALEKSLQFSWRMAKGERARAEKSLLVVRGLMHFLCRGLIPFWRA